MFDENINVTVEWILGARRLYTFQAWESYKAQECPIYKVQYQWLCFFTSKVAYDELAVVWIVILVCDQRVVSNHALG